MVVLTSKVAAHGIRVAAFFWKLFERTRHNLDGPHPHHRADLTSCHGFTNFVSSITITTTAVHSFIHIHKLVHLDNDFTGPTVKAVLTMLAGSQTRLPAQAPFPKFHPDAACAVILLKCKPQIQLCLLWLRRPSVNTQRCHNVAITAGQYFNNNLFGQLQLHH